MLQTFVSISSHFIFKEPLTIKFWRVKKPIMPLWFLPLRHSSPCFLELSSEQQHRQGALCAERLFETNSSLLADNNGKMPSASTKSSQPPPQFNMADILQDPLKGAVSVMEKKLRNLEKRKVYLTIDYNWWITYLLPVIWIWIHSILNWYIAV